MFKAVFLLVLVAGVVFATELTQGGAAGSSQTCGECQVSLNGVCKRVKNCITEDSGLHSELFEVLRKRQEALARNP